MASTDDQLRKTYDIAEGLTPEKLSVSVTKMMDKGWLPQGSPYWHERTLVWMQAMTLTEVSAGDGEVKLKEQKKK